MTTVKTRKKLIEVALPLEAINKASAAEKQPGIGAHPRGLHLYWARRPLATARAVIFAQMVDDPSANPELFATEKAQDLERKRLFGIIEDLVKWENTTNEVVLQAARDEIWASWRRTCADNADHPQAKEIFNRQQLPAFHDPFAGGGALPLEAQRLGLASYATDLNPVAVLINKAMIEIPTRFAGQAPVNPGFQLKSEQEKSLTPWKGTQGIAEDVRYYGEWMRDEARKRIGHLYPKIKVTAEMAKERPDLKKYIGQELAVISWLWARTVKSPNPAFSNIAVPLVSTYHLSTKLGKEANLEPVIENGSYRFVVKSGKSNSPADETKNGTKLSRGANFKCIMSGAPMPSEYIYSEGKAGRMGVRMTAIIAEGHRGRVYLEATSEQLQAAMQAKPDWRPSEAIAINPRAFSPPLYGMKTYGDIFTDRQLVALNTFSDLIGMVRQKITTDAQAAGLSGTSKPLREGGKGAVAYAEAVSVYLAFAINRLADYNSTLATWKPSGEQVMQTFKRQALPMTWDFAESNILGEVAICWENAVKYTADNLWAVAKLTTTATVGHSFQSDASTQTVSSGKVISTDPPYYDNIGYADLSDFFYVWLNRSLSTTYPELFTTLVVPKTEELVAEPYRHGTKEKAELFFLEGMTQAMNRLALQSHPFCPVTIYYAFRQSESDEDEGTTNTGWDTFLEAVIEAGFSITGTWPMRTEMSNRMVGSGTNALASSIVLVCQKRKREEVTTTRRDFLNALKGELPKALAHLQAGNIAPVDLAQASIGPGMAIFTRYSRILGADGSTLSVREALALVNQVLDEQLSEQEGNWDADTRWGVTWFEQSGFSPGEFGVAELLAKAKNTSVQGLVQAGFVSSGAGKVTILRPDDLPADWAPEKDERLTVWEMLHHLIRLSKVSESLAADMLGRLGERADAAKELAYRLYAICERKKRSKEAQLYNELITVWPDLVILSRGSFPSPIARTGELELDA